MSKRPHPDYHRQLWNTALIGEMPEDIMDCAVGSDDEDDDYFDSEDFSGVVQPPWTADDIENMEVIFEDQGGCQAGTSGPQRLPVEEVRPGGMEGEADCGSVREAAGDAGSGSVGEATRAAGSGSVGEAARQGGAPRLWDTAFQYSDDSEFSDDDDDDPVLGTEESDEEDATDFVPDPAACVPEDDEPFVWSRVAGPRGNREAFTAENVGPTSLFMDPYSAFTAIWDESIMEYICTETNRYFVQEMEKEVRAEHSRTKYWQDTTVSEMYTFFAIILLMGIVQMPSIESYFSLNYLLHHQAFGYIMSKHRYRLLSAFLHFANNEEIQGYEGDKKLFKMKFIIDHCNRKFKELYIPSQNIAIDESLTLWKGRLSWKQYIGTKAAKFGIKTFELCESATGYMWSFLVFTGAGCAMACDVVPTGALKSTGIVMTLIRPLLNKGYTLWMDNWFNSPWLAKYLKTRQTDCVGTLNKNRKALPAEIKTDKPAYGMVHAFYTACSTVFSWMDKRRVLLISTFHNDAMRTVAKPGRRPRVKPEIVLDYNVHMGGVDRKDQMLSSYLVERKRGKKWFVKFFKRLLNVSVLNAKIILEASTKKKIGHLEFRLKLIDSILRQHLHLARPNGPPVPQNILNRHSDNTPLNVQPPGAHLLIDLPKRKDCVVCRRQGKRPKVTHYQCRTCEVPVCVTPCFEIFHESEFRNFFTIGKTRRRK